MNLIVILIGITVSGFIYSLSNFLSAQQREKLKQASKSEIVAMVMSGIILSFIILLSLTTCELASSSMANFMHYVLSQAQLPPYLSQFENPALASDPISFSEYYVGQLLFTQGTGLFVRLFSTTIDLYISSYIINYLFSGINLAPNPISFSKGVIDISFSSSYDFVGYFSSFDTIISSTFTGFIVASYGTLFILFIALFAIEFIALDVVLPVALILRSLVFMGPKLREAADSFLSIAIASYFIFPLAIMFDFATFVWVFYASPQAIRQYVEVPQPIPTNTFFSSYTPPSSFNGLNNSFSYSFNVYSLFSVPGFTAFLESLFNIPALLDSLSGDVAAYVFQSIVMLAVAAGISIGFAIGLSKGLSSIPNLIKRGDVLG
ncbi:MAG: hypothetical protein QXL16_01170 [Candidatus Micrarchaeaceae archaeon]